MDLANFATWWFKNGGETGAGQSLANKAWNAATEAEQTRILEIVRIHLECAFGKDTKGVNDILEAIKTKL